MCKVVSFSLPQQEQMDRLIDAVCPPDGESNYLEWSVNANGGLDLFEEEKRKLIGNRGIKPGRGIMHLG